VATRITLSKSTVLLSAVLAGLLAGCVPSGGAEPAQSVDEAMLLMLSSQRLLSQMPAEMASSRPKGLMALLARSAGGRNEAWRLADWYQNMADSLPQDDDVKQHFVDRAEEYAKRGKEVDQERERAERRRQRGFFRWFGRQVRNVGNGLGRAISGAMGLTGAVIEYVIEEEIPARIRAAIRAEWERIRQLAQGRIDAFWQRLAERYGDVVAGYVRDRVDPLFVRLRDRVTGRARRNARRTQTAQVGEPTPAEFQLPATGQWQMDCDLDEVTYTIPVNSTVALEAAAVEFSIDLESRRFQIDITGSGHTVDADGVPDESIVWNVSGSGQVTEEGLLYGAGQHVADSTWLTDRYNYEPTDYNFPVAWVGIVADDLKSVAFAECARPDSTPTLEQVLAAGRGAFSGSVVCGGYGLIRCAIR
jgi:hypothetical protein